MFTTIREQITASGKQLSDTIYRDWTAELLDFPVMGGNFYEWKEGRLCYKKIVSAVAPEELLEQLPQLEGMTLPTGQRQPYFVCGLEQLQEAKRAGRKIGIEGGPCLFGMEEVDVELTLLDGKRLRYDYSSGTPANSGEALDDFVTEHGELISDITYTRKKQKLTSQEWSTLCLLFEAAAALEAVLVISLPDMSYCKYLLVPLESVEKTIRQKAIEEFRTIAYEITDIYLEAIERLKSSYPKVDVTVFHERQKELCARFYEKRVPFVETKKALNKLTSARERLEYVKDYTALPALPYYLFGITDILEINSLYEADSVRKCKKLHGDVFQMAALMFVEKLSADGEHVIYDAALPYKEYIE